MRFSRAFLCVLAISIAGVALGATADAAPLALHLKWRLLAPTADLVFGAGPYVGYDDGWSPNNPPFVVIDDESGQRTSVRAPGCDASAMSTTWIAFDCRPDSYLAGRQFRLYNLRTHRWRHLRCGAICTEGFGLIEVVGVGTRWLLLNLPPRDPCGDGVHNECGQATDYVVNIATGRILVAPNATSSTTEFDLDSPTLRLRICPPLQVPAGYVGSDVAPLKFFGPYAVVYDPDAPYLARCGSHLHVPLPPGAGGFGNRDAVVSVGNASPFASGIFLPSLRRFTFQVPTGLTSLVLGPRPIYRHDTHLGLWVAAFPAGPREAERQPR